MGGESLIWDKVLRQFIGGSGVRGIIPSFRLLATRDLLATLDGRYLQIYRLHLLNGYFFDVALR